MVKCPICGDEVPFEEFEEHYRQHKEEEEKEEEPTVGVSVEAADMEAPIQEVLERTARDMGFESLEQYEKYKDDLFESHKFELVTIYPLMQKLLINSFEYAIEVPEAMPKGMNDPLDFALSDFLPIMLENGTNNFIGFVSKNTKDEVMQRDKIVFPTGNYDVDYQAVAQLIRENGWNKTGVGWVREG
jgi:hypothetical protein